MLVGVGFMGVGVPPDAGFALAAATDGTHHSTSSSLTRSSSPPVSTHSCPPHTGQGS
ncbi:hypothetical protein M2352_001941 [Azospirillum fermentarium]|nr:hypothetical protein [Azospirillum fermentarium]